MMSSLGDIGVVGTDLSKDLGVIIEPSHILGLQS